MRLIFILQVIVEILCLCEQLLNCEGFGTVSGVQLSTLLGENGLDCIQSLLNIGVVRLRLSRIHRIVKLLLNQVLRLRQRIQEFGMIILFHVWIEFQLIQHLKVSESEGPFFDFH